MTTENPDNAKSVNPSRLPLIDALKAIASQLIVIHHLAFYGPMSDYALPIAPKLIPWLYDYARIAVQAFLVMGGFLAAQSLACDGVLINKPAPGLLWRRYLKLVPPYIGALLLAMCSAAIASQLMVHESIPEPPTLARFVAHVFLLQSVLGFDGLSAGIWYVAIDFQIYALLLFTLWVARRISPDSQTLGRMLVATLIVASLFWFNRNDNLDDWAIYFFGAYGLGTLVYWTIQRHTVSAWPGIVGVLAIAALVIDFRSRIVVALAVAVVLGFGRYTGFIETWPRSRLIGWFGRISYSVFLVHFPVCLLINALFERFASHAPEIQLGGMFAAWLASIAAGAVFYRQVECRAQRWFKR
ncbi:MAG: acyltransferase [Smithella sp.]|jgi:peptidoglycan/LPS O-acetylase OafA/YrhL